MSAGRGAGLWQVAKANDASAAVPVEAFFFFLMIFIFSIIVGLQCFVNFLLYSKVSQSPMYITL